MHFWDSRRVWKGERAMFDNEMQVSFLGISQNEAFARMAAAAFASQLNPTIEELTDIRTAVKLSPMRSFTATAASGALLPCAAP